MKIKENNIISIINALRILASKNISTSINDECSTISGLQKHSLVSSPMLPNIINYVHVAGKKIGKCTYHLRQGIGSNQYLPKEWYLANNSTKRYLWVEHISTEQEYRQKGYGREIMKQLYLESIKEGCEGRIVLCAINKSPKFYDKLGFENAVFKNKQKALLNISPDKNGHYPCEEGILYFDPTEENVQKLFKTWIA